MFRSRKKFGAASDYDRSLMYANRWNPAGSSMLYASTHLPLACPEMLVHLSPKPMSPFRLVICGALDGTRQAGYRWATAIESQAILVPSVVLPEESYISWSDPKFLNWDKRLVPLVMGYPLL